MQLFLGQIFKYLRKSSAIALIISEIENGLQVPLVSFDATDPTLSALQFPFFLQSHKVIPTKWLLWLIFSWFLWIKRDCHLCWWWLCKERDTCFRWWTWEENTEDCSKMAFANPVWCRKHHWYAQYIIKSKLISPCVYGTSLWWNLLISSLSSGSLKLVLNSPLFFTFYFDRCIAYAFHKMKMTTFTHLYDHKYQRHESNTILWHPTQVTILFCNAKETQLSRQQIENGEKKVSYLKIVINFFNCEYIQLI